MTKFLRMLKAELDQFARKPIRAPKRRLTLTCRSEGAVNPPTLAQSAQRRYSIRLQYLQEIWCCPMTMPRRLEMARKDLRDKVYGELDEPLKRLRYEVAVAAPATQTASIFKTIAEIEKLISPYEHAP